MRIFFCVVKEMIIIIMIYLFYCAFGIFLIIDSYYRLSDMSFGFVKEEKVSIVFNMMIIKKFSKDVLSLNKIFKRNIVIFWNNNKSFEKKLVDAGINEKDANNIALHPTIIAELKEGGTVVTNLTSSSCVQGQKTEKVGVNQKTGEDSNIPINKINIVKTEAKELVKGGKDFFNKVSPSIENMAKEISKLIESTTGKEVKNKYELIKSFKDKF
jgi:hypothetical protein